MMLRCPFCNQMMTKSLCTVILWPLSRLVINLWYNLLRTHEISFSKLSFASASTDKSSLNGLFIFVVITWNFLWKTVTTKLRNYYKRLSGHLTKVKFLIKWISVNQKMLSLKHIQEKGMKSRKQKEIYGILWKVSHDWTEGILHR
jgi:hypothetical protein